MSNSLSDNSGTQKRTVVGFVIAVAVILGVVFYNTQYSSDELSGTIGKRKVLRSSARGDVALNKQKAQFSRVMQNKNFVDLVESAPFQNMLSNKAFMNLLASAEFQNMLANRSFANILSNREFANAFASQDSVSYTHLTLPTILLV